MKNSIFSIVEKNICVILIVSILVASIYYLKNVDHNQPKNIEFFIPEKPSMNEYYIHKVRDCPKLINRNVKFFMAIPYGDNLVSKNNLWNMVRDCSTNKKYIPKTYLLDNHYDNIQFSKDFSDKKLYILKKNTHRKEGIKLFRDKKSEAFKEYQQGGYKLIQEFIENPYLVNNRIMVIRLYVVIYKDTKYHYYLHKYGKCLYTSSDFSLENIDTHRLITDSKIKLDNTFPKNLDELNKKDKKIKLKLLEKPINTILECFRNYIRKLDEKPEKQFVTFFQLFGIDVILDSNYNPYLLEINKSPDMNNIYDESDRKGKTEVISDMKELIKGSKNRNFKMI